LRQVLSNVHDTLTETSQSDPKSTFILAQSKTAYGNCQLEQENADQAAILLKEGFVLFGELKSEAQFPDYNVFAGRIRSGFSLHKAYEQQGRKQASIETLNTVNEDVIEFERTFSLLMSEKRLTKQIEESMKSIGDGPFE